MGVIIRPFLLMTFISRYWMVGKKRLAVCRPTWCWSALWYWTANVLNPEGSRGLTLIKLLCQGSISSMCCTLFTYAACPVRCHDLSVRGEKKERKKKHVLFYFI